LYWLFWHY